MAYFESGDEILIKDFTLSVRAIGEFKFGLMKDESKDLPWICRGDSFPGNECRYASAEEAIQAYKDFTRKTISMHQSMKHSPDEDDTEDTFQVFVKDKEIPLKNLICIQREEGGYIATIPDFPGCSAYGDTIEEAALEIQDAAAAWIQAAKATDKEIPDKLQPHSIEAEKAVLGALILDNEALKGVFERLMGNDFYLPKHQVIFRAIYELAINTLPFDVLAISNWLAKLNRLSEAGGEAYLFELAKNAPTSKKDTILAYADVVKERSLLRQLLRVVEEIKEGIEERKCH